MAFARIQSGKVLPVVVDTQGVRAPLYHKAIPSPLRSVSSSYVATKRRINVSMNSIPAQMNVMPRMNHSDSNTTNNKDAQYEHHTRNLPWFQKAVEDIVRKLDGRVDTDQFVQVVKMGNNPCQADYMATCDITASGHPTCSVDNVDAVILVKRIATGVDLKTHLDVDVVQTDAVTEEPSNGDVQIACDQLMRSGVGRRILHGRVGECCERQIPSGDSPSAASVLVNQATRHVASREAVKAAALPKKPFQGYWGVVVQAKEKSSIEGCYLLKAGCSVVDGGCSCTHFSLTRVQSEHVSVHQQFVDSWRA